jgi:general secretion pathway protein B
MSSILKALQKVEEEKAARHAGETGLTSNLLRSGRVAERRPLPLLVGMVAVAAVAVLVTYILMGGFSRRREMVQPTPPTTVVQQPVAELPKASPPIQPEPVADVAPSIVVPAPQSENGRKPSPLAPTAKKAAARPAAAPKALGTVAVPRNNESVAPTDGEVDTPAQAVSVAMPQVAPEPGKLKVSGIAWQKDATSSVAVINGHAVMKGGMVEGFKVEDISPDRVRFAGEGRTFELFIGETGK